MAAMFKKIVVLQGLYPISDKHFEIIKCLLRQELTLQRNSYEKYNRLQFADLMAKKFKTDAGLGKLIEIFKEIPELEDHAAFLRKEMSKVQRKCRERAKTTGNKSQQDEASSVQCALNTDEDSQPESKMDVSMMKVTKAKKNKM